MSQSEMSFHSGTSYADHLARIRCDARTITEQGNWFEALCMRLLTDPQTSYRIKDVWRWKDWPDRELITGQDGRDTGIDLVAEGKDGSLIAVQCKCYDPGNPVSTEEINKFITAAAVGRANGPGKAFDMGWVLTTSKLNRTAQNRVDTWITPQIRVHDFLEYANCELVEEDAIRPVREPWEMQHAAIRDVVEGLRNHDRGNLVMACGTGKTFCSLRISEAIVPEGGRILFAAPSIALVSQARNEWLEHTNRHLDGLVVCSDSSAGGGKAEDIRVSEMKCLVTTDPTEIHKHLCADGTSVVFATYQSLAKVIEAQTLGAPSFNLAIADEAHRTTGLFNRLESGAKAREVDFQAFHEALGAQKRLYMTATPKIFTERSKVRLREKGERIADMSDASIYGNEFHRIKFKDAVDAGMLSDYRVVILGVPGSEVGVDMRTRLQNIEGGDKMTTDDMSRMFCAFYALNGGMRNDEGEDTPDVLPRALGFASSIRRSEWYRDAFNDPQVKRKTTLWLEENSRGNRHDFIVDHIDGRASAHTRLDLISKLRTADEKSARFVTNCKLFSEGVDIPTLDAIVFLDPKSSQIDIVQAVGRVMRKAEGKKRGYIVVPVVVEPGENVAESLEREGRDFKTVGKVLRALQSHDERLAATPAEFVRVVDVQDGGLIDRTKGGGGVTDRVQGTLPLESVPLGLYARLIAKSGLRAPGEDVAEEIAYTVRNTGRVFRDEGLAEALGRALGKTIDLDDEKEVTDVCTTAALVITNGCLLHRRLRKNDVFPGLTRLEYAVNSKNPAEHLKIAWRTILDRDYRPVFKPALQVMCAIDEARNEAVNTALAQLVVVAKNQADKLVTLGYDYAGPLYHKVLSSAKSDGAFYTKNTFGLLLAGLALPPEGDPVWSNPERIADMKIIDPACGTGTLLMAALQIIKRRAGVARGEGDSVSKEAALQGLHHRLVENGIYGFDINSQAVQMAASNLTLGATSVDYQKMNLHTLKHGVESDGRVKAGALELLVNEKPDLLSVTYDDLTFGAQVDDGDDIRMPAEGFDVVIMNPPFSNNAVRGEKFSAEDKKRMQQHELAIAESVRVEHGEGARAAISSNAIESFFPVLAEKILCANDGAVMGEVVPIAGCLGAGSAAKRRFLAEQFHIERIVVCHSNKADGARSNEINFTSNTGMFECLLIAKRISGNLPPTEIVHLDKHPKNESEVHALIDAIASGDMGDWGELFEWPRARIVEGDWSGVVWRDMSLDVISDQVEAMPCFTRIGDLGADEYTKNEGGGLSRPRAATSSRSSCELERGRVYSDVREGGLGPAGRRIVDAWRNHV